VRSESTTANIFFWLGSILILVGSLLAIAGVPMGSVSPAVIALIGLAPVVYGLDLNRRAALQISDQKQAQLAKLENLQTQIDSQRDAIDTLAEGLDAALMICDARGAIEYANGKARALFRAEAPEGKFLLTVTLSHETEALVQKVAATGQPEIAELSFSYPSEEVGLVKAWPSSGNRVFLSIFEITELRKLERIRKDFVANVSHEMRTPMTIIRAMAETLLDEDDDQLKEKYLAKIISEVDRLSSISQDLLILSTAELNPVRKQDCDIAEIFRTALAQLQIKAADKALTLRYEGPPQCSISANSAQMVQIAINLIDNAINYTASGEVVVTLTPMVSAVQIDIRDTGYGIASEHLGRIFERFYRVDRARSRSTGGTGLGLSIVKHIVESHGGTVSVVSSLNEGSTFTVILPTH